nr:16S rRNA (uracil(1498)-N(3))-methyltransferase [Bacteroidota bacterium]
MHWFFANQISGSQFEFSPEESKHCHKVLRLQVGDPVILTNGMGEIYEAELKLSNPKKCILEIKSRSKVEKDRPATIHIAVAPTKNAARLEWFLEKATEIGIDEITLVFCDHSERNRINPDRLHKIMVSAIKQSQQPWLPKLNDPVDLPMIINNSKEDQKFIAFLDEVHNQHLINVCMKGKSSIVLIGPEGDFSKKETELALLAGFQAVNLGNTRLRTETAALVACHTLNLINQK